MRWIERVSGLLAGLLAVVAGLLALQLPAAQVSGNVTTYGPGISPSLHSAIMLPVAITIVAALAIALVALLDTRRPAHSRALTALAVIATIGCAIGAGILLAGNVSLVFAAPPLHRSGLIQQYNAGALFTPALVAAILFDITIIWPRRPTPATAARASR